jgi:hypothetical protein
MMDETYRTKNESDAHRLSPVPFNLGLAKKLVAHGSFVTRLGSIRYWLAC